MGQSSKKAKILIPLIAFLGFSGLCVIYTWIIPGKIKVEVFENQNPIVTAYGAHDGQKQELSNQIAIALYQLAIINNTRKNKTIKDFKLAYKYEDTVFYAKSIYVQVGDEDALVWYSPPKSPRPIVIMNWKNIQSKIYEFPSIEPGGVIYGSTLFVLDKCNINDKHLLSNIKFIITDFEGKKYKTKFTIKDDYLGFYNKGYRWKTKPWYRTSKK